MSSSLPRWHAWAAFLHLVQAAYGWAYTRDTPMLSLPLKNHLVIEGSVLMDIHSCPAFPNHTLAATVGDNEEGLTSTAAYQGR